MGVKNFKKEMLCVLAGAAIALLVIDDATSRKLDAQLQQEEYCSMVKLHQTSNGKLGWPDYRKQYKELCE